MKKIISLILLVIFLFVCCVACDNSTGSSGGGSNNNGGYTPPPSNIDVTSVNISKTNIEMTVGEKQAISATISPSNATNKQLTWSSSNTAVADYVNGEIIALGVGYCVIKVTSSNGIVASCTVSVERAPILAEKVEFPIEIAYIGVGEVGRYTNLTISPQELDSYNGTTTSSDPTIVTATYSQNKEGKVIFTPKKAGTATITVTLEGGQSDSITIVVLDANKLIKVNVPDLPTVVAYIYDRSYSTPLVRSVARIESIGIAYLVMDKNTIRVTLTIKGVKVNDKDGSKGTQDVAYLFHLYKEDGVFCGTEQFSEYFLNIGDGFTHTYTFDAVIDDAMTPREFTITLSDFVS